MKQEFLKNKPYKKIFVGGTFDNFHIGHQYLLWKSSSLAEILIIIVAREGTVKRLKGEKPKNSENKRFQRIKAEKIPNAIVRLGRKDADFYKTIQEEQPDAIFLGYDQDLNISNFNQKFPNIKIVRLNAYFPHLYKSSKF